MPLLSRSSEISVSDVLRHALRPLGMPFDVIVVSERYTEDWGSVEGRWCTPR